MQKITFEDTTVTKQPYVTINDIEYEVTDGTYSGGTDLNANTFNTMQDNIEEAIKENKNVQLIAISDTAPTTFTTGDKYYNTSTNKVYTALNDSTWNNGETPLSDIFYILFSEQSSYSYDGTTLVSVGGGTEDIIISDEEPQTDDWKIWIDSGAVSSQASEITNSYSESTGIGYSTNYTNDKLVKVGTTNDDNFKVNFTKGKNLLSRGNIINGIYGVSTGTYTYSATSLCTKNKIEIDNTKNYVVSASSSTTSEFMYIMFYDASGTYLGNISTTFQVGQIKLNTYANYSNAKYINIRFDQPNVSSPMLEEGDTKTTFEEYYADVLVDNNKVYDQNRLDNAFIEQPYNQQDFNNYTIPGSYMINNTSLSNIPVSAPGVLMVWVGNYSTPGTKYIAQLYISNQGAHSRFRDTGATQWGAWRQLHN